MYVDIQILKKIVEVMQFGLFCEIIRDVEYMYLCSRIFQKIVNLIGLYMNTVYKSLDS